MTNRIRNMLRPLDLHINYGIGPEGLKLYDQFEGAIKKSWVGTGCRPCKLAVDLQKISEATGPGKVRAITACVVELVEGIPMIDGKPILPHVYMTLMAEGGIQRGDGGCVLVHNVIQKWIDSQRKG